MGEIKTEDGKGYVCPISCPKGNYCGMVSSEPTKCQVGFYNDEYHAEDSCKLCKIGYACSEEGIEELDRKGKFICKRGKICATEGMSQ